MTRANRVELSLDEHTLRMLFLGGGMEGNKGDDIGLTLALNVLKEASMELHVLAEAAFHGTADMGYTEQDVGNLIHHIAHRLQAASELVQATSGQKFKASMGSEVAE